MAMVSIGDALNQFFTQSKWKEKMNAIRIVEDWEKIMGKTIAKYTSNIQLRHGTLSFSTNIPPLKQELMTSRQQIIDNVNAFYNATVVQKVIIY